MLANSNKYLIHVIIKGLKNDFRLVIELFKTVHSNCQVLMKIFAKKTEGISSTIQILNILKAGFYSNNSTVAQWACRTIENLGKLLQEKGFVPFVWDWFISDNGGLQSILEGTKKNNEIIGEFSASMLYEFSRYNYNELFTRHFPRILSDPKDLLLILTEFLQYIAEHTLSRDEFVKSGVFAYIFDFGCRKADVDNSSVGERASGLTLLLEIWITFPTIIEEKNEYAEYIIKLMQRANRDRSQNLQIVSITCLFKLLELFTLEKNPYAPTIYKTLIFALVENHQKTLVREYIMSNYKALFETFNVIPVKVLVEPLIKQVFFTNIISK